MRDSWDNMFEEVPASFEARMKETLSALEEKPKIRRFRFGTGALVAAALLVAVLGGTALSGGVNRAARVVETPLVGSMAALWRVQPERE